MSADAAASGAGTTDATSTATATDGKAAKGKPISIFSIVMLTMAAVLSLRNFPTMATYGWSSITWYVLGTLLFMVPISLIGAELATGPWRQEGGVFAWVRAGVGDRPGMIAVWCEWTENIVWFPTVLSFLAASLFYAFNPDLANNNVAMFVVMLGTFWAVTLLNFKGVQASSVLNNVGTMLGSILPAVVLVVAMVIFLLQGNSSEIPFSGSAMVPDFSVGNLPFVATVVLIFAGMEMGGYQADKMENPQRDFPKAIFVSALFIVAATVLATIAIAIVVPTRDISLAAGLMQAFDSFFDQLNAGWLTPVMAVLVVLGSAAQLNSWLLGPAQGLSVVRTGDLPPMFLRQNRNGAPVSVLLLQGALGTLFSCLFLFMPGVNSSYWILSALTTEIFCVMYTLIFISAIKLRYSKPVEQFPRSYTVPGGMLGMWLIGGVGLVAIVFTFIVGLIPSDQLKSGNTAVYVIGMFVGTMVLSFFPLVFKFWRKPQWRMGAAPQAAAATGGA
jgi:glutamate:GABA antiporter